MIIKNYKHILQENENKTKMVIFTFLLTYIFIGLITDMLLHLHYNLGFSQLFFALITFKIIPVATIVLCFVAVISVIVAFSIYDKIMLWGTEYREINPDNVQLNLIDKQLYNIVEELKIAANLKFMPKVFIINAPYMNAFASGYSEKSAMVAITTGLIEKLNRAEIQAVMAHELSHIRHLDIKLTLFIGVLSNIMLLVVDFLYNLLFFTSNRRDNRNNNAGGLVALVIFFLKIFLPVFTLLLTLYLSRTRELMADAGSVELTRDKESMVNALLKIHNNYQQNKYHDEGMMVRQAAYIYNPVKNAFNEALSTHPSLQSRLKALGFNSKIEE
jgi:heat shock protein HtpX